MITTLIQSGTLLQDALTFASAHPKLIKGLIAYFIFSNVVSTMPRPRGDSVLAELYAWAYRLSHVVAGNAGRLITTWLPASKQILDPQIQAPESPAEKEPEKKEEGK